MCMVHLLIECGLIECGAQLGFENREELLLMAKTGILAASLLSGVAGFIWLYVVSKPN